jgi:hypothetical protein
VCVCVCVRVRMSDINGLELYDIAVARAFKPLQYDPSPVPPSTWTRGSESIQSLMPYNQQLMGLGAVALAQRSIDEIDDQLIWELKAAILCYCRDPDAFVADIAHAAPSVSDAARLPVSEEAYARYLQPWVVEFPDQDYHDDGLDSTSYTSGVVFFYPQAQIGMHMFFKHVLFEVMFIPRVMHCGLANTDLNACHILVYRVGARGSLGDSIASVGRTYEKVE